MLGIVILLTYIFFSALDNGGFIWSDKQFLHYYPQLTGAFGVAFIIAFFYYFYDNKYYPYNNFTYYKKETKININIKSNYIRYPINCEFIFSAQWLSAIVRWCKFLGNSRLLYIMVASINFEF